MKNSSKLALQISIRQAIEADAHIETLVKKAQTPRKGNKYSTPINCCKCLESGGTLIKHGLDMEGRVTYQHQQPCKSKELAIDIRE